MVCPAPSTLFRPTMTREGWLKVLTLQLGGASTSTVTSFWLMDLFDPTQTSFVSLDLTATGPLDLMIARSQYDRNRRIFEWRLIAS